MTTLQASERGSFIVFQLGTALTVVAYGIVHDQWLMSVSPDHFNVYHDTLVETNVPRLNTAMLALIATLGPGLLLGCLLWVAARWGQESSRLSFRCVWKKLIVLLVLMEGSAALIGFLSARLFEARGEGGLLLPATMFPELRGDLVVAQTIQIFTYAAAAIGSLLLLWRVRCTRCEVGNKVTSP